VRQFSASGRTLTRNRLTPRNRRSPLGGGIRRRPKVRRGWAPARSIGWGPALRAFSLRLASMPDRGLRRRLKGGLGAHKAGARRAMHSPERGNQVSTPSLQAS
jgi:hypothetical protein